MLRVHMCPCCPCCLTHNSTEGPRGFSCVCAGAKPIFVCAQSFAWLGALRLRGLLNIYLTTLMNPVIMHRPLCTVRSLRAHTQLCGVARPIGRVRTARVQAPQMDRTRTRSCKCNYPACNSPVIIYAPPCCAAAAVPEIRATITRTERSCCRTHFTHECRF